MLKFGKGLNRIQFLSWNPLFFEGYIFNRSRTSLLGFLKLCYSSFATFLNCMPFQILDWAANLAKNENFPNVLPFFRIWILSCSYEIKTGSEISSRSNMKLKLYHFYIEYSFPDLLCSSMLAQPTKKPQIRNFSNTGKTLIRKSFEIYSLQKVLWYLGTYFCFSENKVLTTLAAAFSETVENKLEMLAA